MKTTKDILHSYTVEREGKPTSERSYLIQQIADALRVPFKNVFNEVWHLRDKWGCNILRMILEETLRTGDKIEYRALKCRELIDKSKGK